MTTRRVAIGTGIAAIAFAAARADARSPLAEFEGTWRGAGTFQGAPSRVSARFAPSLGGAGWTLDIRIVADLPKGETVTFAGHAVYVIEDGVPVRGTWADSQGSTYLITLRIDGSALIVDWGEGARAVGRSEYRIVPEGSLRIEDSLRGLDGRWARFAQADLRRNRR